MKQTKYLLILLLPLGFVAGCIQGQANISLNPDGSGKIAFEGLYDPCCCSENTENVSQTFQNFVKQVKNTLVQCRGVEAWKDVNWRILDNGKIYFKAQAYFKSIDDVAIYLGNIRGSLKASYQKNEKQQCLVELKSLITEPNLIYSPGGNAPEHYKLFRETAEQMLKTLRLDIILNLPSEIASVEGFSKIDSRTVQHLIDGSQMVYLLETIKKQERYELAERWNYNRAEFINNELLPMWYGSQKPLRVYFADSNERLFDYEKEKSEAQKEYHSITERLESAAGIVIAGSEPNKVEISQPNIPPDSTVEIDTDINARLRSGLAIEAKADYERAAEIYSRLIADNRTASKYRAQAYYRKGMCLFEMGQTDKAIEQFNYVLSNFSSQQVASLRSLKMIQDIRSGTAKRKTDKKSSDAPTVVSTSPDNFINDVNSKLDKIVIKFSEPMDDSCWFYSSFAPGILPQITAEPSFDLPRQEWTLPVRLEPGKIYAIAFNCGDAVKDKENFKAGFRSFSGKMSRPFILVFATADGNNMPTEIGETLISKSEEINSKP